MVEGGEPAGQGWVTSSSVPISVYISVACTVAVVPSKSVGPVETSWIVPPWISSVGCDTTAATAPQPESHTVMWVMKYSPSRMGPPIPVIWPQSGQVPPPGHEGKIEGASSSIVLHPPVPVAPVAAPPDPEVVPDAASSTVLAQPSAPSRQS